MNPLRWLSALLLGLALVAGAALWLQREAALTLREEIAALREEQRGVEQLRAENRRLGAVQVSDAELARLRDDHAAVVRLRAEIEKLKTTASSAAK